MIKEDDKKMFGNNGGRSQAVYLVRILVGAYLIYIDYSIFDDVMAREGTSRVVITAIMVMFAIVGVALILISARTLLGISSGGDGMKTDGEETDDAAGNGGYKTDAIEEKDEEETDTAGGNESEDR